MQLKIYSMDAYVGSFKVEADKLTNRLFIIMKGYLVNKELRMIAEKIKSEAKKLKPGFDIINDISQLRTSSVGSDEIIYNCQKYLLENGAGRIVRVVESQEETKAQEVFKNGADEIGYEVIYAKSVHEASYLLDEHGIKKLVSEIFS